MEKRLASPIVVAALTAIGASLPALAVSAQTYLSMRGHGHSFTRILAWQFGCWGSRAPVVPWILRTGGRLVTSPSMACRRRILLVGSGLAFIAIHVVFASELTVWLQPLAPVQMYAFREALASQLVSLIVVDVLIYALLVISGATTAAYVRDSMRETELARAQLQALQLEIQPHFLFNTLNSIAALIRSHDHARALDMLLAFSELMRTTIDHPAQQMAKLGSEVDFVKRYVALQRHRFGDRLEVAFDISDGCRDAAVPTFLLQPLVENAIRHGMRKLRRPCRVEVGAHSAESARPQIRVWVRDNGTGLPAGFELERDAGVGLRNARSRLQQLYGGDARLTIHPNQDAGTTVELLLPLLSNSLSSRGA